MLLSGRTRTRTLISREMDAYEDTDTLLALVSSLLTTPTLDSAIILNTLVQCDGDVSAAAEILNTRYQSPGGSLKKKRKRSGDLDNWLMSSPRKESRPMKSEGSKRPLSLGPTSPSKPVVDLMTVLRQPPSAPQSAPRLPPLTLSNPSLVAQHTPCTLHLSVLPRELACKLFYTMVDASKSWTQNKWWLVDRVVSSPHRTSFYARRQNGVDGDCNWQEAAQYW